MRTNLKMQLHARSLHLVYPKGKNLDDCIRCLHYPTRLPRCLHCLCLHCLHCLHCRLRLPCPRHLHPHRHCWLHHFHHRHCHLRHHKCCSHYLDELPSAVPSYGEFSLQNCSTVSLRQERDLPGLCPLER